MNKHWLVEERKVFIFDSGRYWLETKYFVVECREVNFNTPMNAGFRPRTDLQAFPTKEPAIAYVDWLKSNKSKIVYDSRDKD